MKDINDIDFNKIDYSRYKKELDEIYKTVEELKKNKRLMKILRRYEKKRSKNEKKI